MQHKPLPSAVLLLGPTGAGKTPLGDLIAKRGLGNSDFVHFDFGENLRRLVRQNRPGAIIGREDLDFLHQVLDSGALLEDEHFRIAEAVLKSFLAEHNPDGRAKVLLNGLPRHVGQANAIDEIVSIETVICLASSSHIILERIRTNIGGDRAGRADDDLESIRNKLEIFAGRTAPLADRYRETGTPIHTLEVTATMSPEDAWHLLNRGKEDR